MPHMTLLKSPKPSIETTAASSKGEEKKAREVGAMVLDEMDLGIGSADGRRLQFFARVRNAQTVGGARTRGSTKPGRWRRGGPCAHI